MVASARHAAKPSNWDQLRVETARTLADYLKADATQAPGNEVARALYLRRILDQEGIEAGILDTASRCKRAIVHA
jgi:hypothetical protein